MGSSNSKTIVAGLEEKTGPELIQSINAVLERGGEPAAILHAIVERIQGLKPVPGSISEKLSDLLPKMVQSIKSALNIDLAGLSDIAITQLGKLLFEIGVSVVPYIAAIALLIATAGNGMAAWEGYTKSTELMKMFDDICNALYAVLSMIPAPEFIDRLPEHIANGKKMFSGMLSRVTNKMGSAEDPYILTKKSYGKKFGSCDCDRVGGDESSVSELGLKSAMEYLETASSAAKRGLAADIIKSISGYIKMTPPSGLSKMEEANWLLANMFEKGGNEASIDPKKVEAALDSLIKLINKYVGKDIIDKKLPKETKLMQAAEILHSLTTGMHLEYLISQQDLLIIQDNLAALGKLQKEMTEGLKKSSKDEMNETDKVNQKLYGEALDLINDEIKRQMGMVTSITTGKFNTADIDIMKMLADGNLLKMHIDEVAPQNPSKQSFQKLIYKLLNMTILTSAVAAVIEEALKTVGMSLDEYKNTGNLEKLKDKLAEKSIETKRSSEDNYKFFKAQEMLQQNFNTAVRHSLNNNRAVAVGARENYPKSQIQKKIENIKNLRSVKLRVFSNNLVHIYKGIENAIEEIIPFVGESIPHDDDTLDIFIERISYLKSDGILKGKVYEALAGAVDDPLAIQIKGEIIGNLKSIISAAKVLEEKSKDAGKGVIKKLIDEIDKIIKLSDQSSDNFRQSLVTGSADLSDSILPNTGITKSMFDLDSVIDKLQAITKVAKVRENVKKVMNDYPGITTEYEQMTGQSIAGVIDDINHYEKKTLETIGTDTGNKVIYDFVVEQCSAMRGVWRASEAIDYYLGNFTYDLRMNSSEINDIAVLMEDISVQKEVYDAKLGNLFTSIFDCFPINGMGTYPSKEVINNNGRQHYYEFFRSSNQPGMNKNYPGLPIYAADVEHSEMALKKTKAFVSKFTIFRNIVNVFYNIGAKYGKNGKTKDSTRYMSPGALLKSLVDYIYTGSFMAVTSDTLAARNKFLTDANAILLNAGINVSIERQTKQSIMALNKNRSSVFRELDKLARDKLNATILDFVTGVENHDMSLNGANMVSYPSAYNNDQTAVAGPGLVGVTAFIHMRSDYYNYLRGDPILVKTDDMFILLIKAMLAKIIACIETYEIMKKPTMYDVSNSGVRQILGGGIESTSIRPEYTELYIRLPLLVKFYKKIFRMDSNEGFKDDYINMDKSRSRSLKISIIPDIDGKYGPLVKYIFKNDKMGIDNFTDSQMAMIIDKINNIIDSIGNGKKPEEITHDVLAGFVKEVNKRFALVTREDYDDYKKLIDQEHNLWDSIKLHNTDDYMNDNPEVLTTEDEDLDVFMRLPSDSYVSSAPGGRGIFGTDPVDYGIDRKFYREYYRLYTRFRRMVDDVLHIPQNMVNVPKLKTSIDSLSRQVSSEPKVHKKLEILSRFLSADDLDLNKYSKAKYVAFHELIVSSLNALSIIDSIITNIITLGYIADPVGLGNAIIYRQQLSGPIAFNAFVNGLEVNGNDDMVATGISRKMIMKLFSTNAVNFINVAQYNSLDAHSGKIRLTSMQGVSETLIPVVIETIYMMTNNKFFDVRLNESGLTVDFDVLKDTIEKLYASAKSALEKFRPHINPAFFDLYVGIISDNAQDNNTAYRIYDDLIRVKLNGNRVTNTANKLDVHAEYYYSLGRGINAINEFIRSSNFKNDTALIGYLRDNIAYDPSATSLNIVDGGSPKFSDWHNGVGAGIERMLLSINGDKTTMDLRFAGRYSGLYTWDGDFTRNHNIFMMMNQLLARFMSRSYDSTLEKMYKGVVYAFEKAFPNEIAEPFLNSWPDFWPAVYFAKNDIPKSVVTEKDNYTIVDNLYLANQPAAGTGTYKVFMLDSPGIITFKTTVNMRSNTAPTMTNIANRPLPNPEKLLYGSLAQIIKNIRSNKTASGSLLNMAESLSEISQTVKDRMKEELPLFKKYFSELSARAKLLIELVEHYAENYLSLTRARRPITNNCYPNGIEETKEDERIYFVRLLSKIVEIGEIFEKAIDDLHIEIGINAEYGELFPGFLKNYQSKFSTPPFIPMSMIFSYVFNGNNLMNNQDNKLIPATKSTTSRYFTNYITNASKVASSPILSTLLQKFDNSIVGPEQINIEDAKIIVDSYVKLMLYVGDCRQYKSIFSSIFKSTSLLNLVTDTSLYVYPERINNNIYSKVSARTYTVAPWTFGLYVSDSSIYRPGIVVTQKGITNVTSYYVNAYFTVNPYVDYLNKVVIYDNGVTYDMIHEHFNEATNTFKNKDAGNDISVIRNIIDLNIIPIDFSGFNRFIPMSNIMNYAYTLERMALDVLVPNDNDRNRVLDVVIKQQGIPISSPEMLIYALLVNPYSNISFSDNPTFGSILGNMFMGNHNIPLGRPKFINDQLFQKALFGSNFLNQFAYNTTGKTVNGGPFGFNTFKSLSTIRGSAQRPNYQGPCLYTLEPRTAYNNVPLYIVTSIVPSQVNGPYYNAVVDPVTGMITSISVSVLWNAGQTPEEEFNAIKDAVRRRLGTAVTIEMSMNEDSAALKVGKFKLQGSMMPESGKNKYFKNQPFNNTVSNNNSVLTYIDPLREGHNKIVEIPTNNIDSYKYIASMRLHSVLTRNIIFIMNAYRITMYRLRKDAKNKSNKIATKPADIMDEDDTEFYGFDMIE